MQWNLCITDSKKYSFISTNIMFFLRGISILFADVAVYQFLRAPKCRTTHSATATGRSRSSDDSLKSSEFNFFNEEVNLLSAMKHRLSKLIYLDRFCISRICRYNDGGWLIKHKNQLRTK